MNELTLTNPRGSLEIANAAVEWIQNRADEILGEMRVLEIRPDNYREKSVKDAVATFKKQIEDLRENGKKMVEKVLEETEALRVITAIDNRLWTYSTRQDPGSAYARLSAELKVLTDRIDEFKSADEPPAPRHAWVIQAELTDAELKKVLAMIGKTGCCHRWALPQSDKAARAIDSFFNTNK